MKTKAKPNPERTFPCRCHRCSAIFPTPPPEGGPSGYVITSEGTHICYTCADAAQREDLKDRSKPFTAYVSTDGQKIETWTGGNLMQVVQSWPCKLTRPSWTHSRSSYRCFRARDVHGGLWYGRGSSGIAITLRPCKG